MRIHAIGGDDQFQMEPELWRPLLALSRQFGWRPSGTVMPVFRPDPADPSTQEIIAYDQHWRGDYLPPAGQVVTGQDAANLMGYLGRALRDIEKLLALPAPGSGAVPGSLQLDDDDARRFFVTPVALEILRTFIAFCDDCVMGFSLPAEAK